MPREPSLPVEDESARPDADEVRSEDAVQDRDIALQLGLAPFFRPLQHVRLGPRSGLDPGRPARFGRRQFPIRRLCVVHGAPQAGGVHRVFGRTISNIALFINRREPWSTRKTSRFSRISLATLSSRTSGWA